MWDPNTNVHTNTNMPAGKVSDILRMRNANAFEYANQHGHANEHTNALPHRESAKPLFRGLRYTNRDAAPNGHIYSLSGRKSPGLLLWRLRNAHDNANAVPDWESSANGRGLWEPNAFAYTSSEISATKLLARSRLERRWCR